MMNERVDIPAELYEDEVVCFFADRYHTSTENVVRCFLVQDGICPEQENEPMTFRLEDNEMEILRGLTYGGHSLPGESMRTVVSNRATEGGTCRNSRPKP